ncbi:MAG: hypothetical protein WBE18_03920 [Gammaproteobacteria bacterium]
MPALKPLRSLLETADKEADKIFATQQKKVDSTKKEFGKLHLQADKIYKELNGLVYELKTMQETYKIAGPRPKPKQVGPTKEGELPQQTPSTGAGRK